MKVGHSSSSFILHPSSFRLFHLRDLLDSPAMTAAFEIRIEECLDHLLGVLIRHKTCRQREDVRVVMFACEASDILVPCDGRTDALHFVCRDRHSRSRAANEQTLLNFTI